MRPMRFRNGLATAFALAACASATRAHEPVGPQTYPNGLLVALAQFEVRGGKVLPNPGPARFEIVTFEEGAWKTRVVEDPESKVFHKAMPFTPASGRAGILTLGGDAATVKLWRPGPGAFAAETLWRASFGGTHSRMRDAEAIDVAGQGTPMLAVATHDQGVVALLRADAQGKYSATELDRRKDTFVHEIEIGDLDGDGQVEIYATPSEPNRDDGSEQPGTVVRYSTQAGQAPQVVAALGRRHAKEILVDDVDGDGRDELYVSVEALTEGAGTAVRIVEGVEIRRYDSGTPPQAARVIARLDDRFCRVLTAGDVDGDGKKEMVAAGFRSGLWLLRPPGAAGGEWRVESIDRQSGGFEHAAVFADLDGDKKDELYVASDNHGELRRYSWTGARSQRETIMKREVPEAFLTWSLVPVPRDVLR